MAVRQGSIRNVAFHRQKYGDELLVDVGWLSELPKVPETIVAGTAHRLDFYDILLITKGTGGLWLDDARIGLRAGTVIFTAPGVVRRWDTCGVEGICIFFREEFLRTFFIDALFVQRLRCFGGGEGRQSLRLSGAEARALRGRLVEMRTEIARCSGDSHHMLRAGLYETLIRLERLFTAMYGVADTLQGSLTLQFRQLVEAEITRQHAVRWYATELGVSPGYLSETLRRDLGETAKAYLSARLITEAKRVLMTGETAERTGRRVGFDDAAYFARFFRRMTGSTPAAFRRRVTD
jgi:AraC-like DNA-binding protein